MITTFVFIEVNHAKNNIHHNNGNSWAHSLNGFLESI